MDAMNDVGIVVLAAGASRRFGRPKQMAVHEGRPLIVHAVETALGTGCEKVAVVFGSRFEEILPAVSDLPVLVCRNRAWREGMGSSIRAGLEGLLAAAPETEAVILTLCDQPLVRSRHLRELAETRARTGRDLVVSAYRDTHGVPALFTKSFYPELRALGGDEGARRIIRRHLDEAAKVPLPEAGADIDTPADLERLNG